MTEADIQRLKRKANRPHPITRARNWFKRFVFRRLFSLGASDSKFLMIAAPYPDSAQDSDRKYAGYIEGKAGKIVCHVQFFVEHKAGTNIVATVYKIRF